MAHGYRQGRRPAAGDPGVPAGRARCCCRGGQLPLNIFEPRYLNMVDDAMAGDRIIGMIQTRRAAPRRGRSLAAVGCAGRITSFAETSDGRYLITLTGVCRFRIWRRTAVSTPYRQVRADFERFDERPDGAGRGRRLPTATRPARRRCRRYLNHARPRHRLGHAPTSAPPEALVNSLSMALPFEPAEKQALLEAPTLADRFES